MTKAGKRSTGRLSATLEKVAPRIRIDLTPADLAELPELAHQYERSMGFVRHIVVATSPARIKRRYRYIVRESKALEETARSLSRNISLESAEKVRIDLKLNDAVAFWGRVLSNLRTRRSRRKLSDAQVDVREHLEYVIATAIAAEWVNNEEAVREAIATRRQREAEWMLNELGADGTPSLAAL